MVGNVWIGPSASNGAYGKKRSAVAKAAALLVWPTAGRDGDPEDGDAVLDIAADGSGAEAAVRIDEWERKGIWVLRGWGSRGGPSDWTDASLQLQRAGFPGTEEDADNEQGGNCLAKPASDRGKPYLRSEAGGPAMSGPVGVAGAYRANRRFFEVPVFHLDALTVRRTGEGRVPADWSESHPLYRKLYREAVRAVYALGLDYSVVRLSADDQGTIRAIRIRSVSAQDVQLWKSAMAAFADGWRKAVCGCRDENGSGTKKREIGEGSAVGGAVGGHGGSPERRDRWPKIGGVDEIAEHGGRTEASGVGRRSDGRDVRHSGMLLIGADPEFVLLRPDGTIVSADRFFPPTGAAGTDTVRSGTRLLRPIVELRPDPAGDPDGLLRNLWRLLHRASALTAGQPLRWLAGAMPVRGVALGGHLHLSGVELNARLLRTLDSFVALPLAAVEDAAGRRRRLRYGALGDFRRQPHGGFEYRTPPSWLV
ncbi:putative amidoligase domain-containing protein, partial [Paenibacillus darwinianus]